MLTEHKALHRARRYANRSGYRSNILLRTGSVEAVRSIVASGRGVTIPSGMVYWPWSLEGKRVDAVSVASEVPRMDIVLAWANDVESLAAAGALAEFIRIATSQRQMVFCLAGAVQPAWSKQQSASESCNPFPADTAWVERNAESPSP